MASALSEASAAELAVPDNKVTENVPQKQMQSMSISINGDVANVTDADGKTVMVIDNNSGSNRNKTVIAKKSGLKSSANVSVYVNGEKRELKALDKIDAADISSIEIKKNDSESSDMYVTVKDKNGNTEKFIAQADTNEAEKPTTKGNKAHNAVETMPQFPGGEAALMQFVADNIRYPEAAMKANKQGRVVVQFVVTGTGKVTDAKVIRSQGAELDAEAVRVVNSMPAFSPGTIDGKAVDCNYVIPISFKLKDDKPAETPATSPK